jgi:hypothetical protein
VPPEQPTRTGLGNLFSADIRTPLTTIVDFGDEITIKVRSFIAEPTETSRSPRARGRFAQHEECPTA